MQLEFILRLTVHDGLWTLTFDYNSQVAQLSQRGRAMLPVCQSINTQFITRHSTAARATMSPSQTEKESLKSVLKMFTDGVVRQLSGREFQSLGAATEKRRAAMSMLCRGTERKLCVDDRNERD